MVACAGCGEGTVGMSMSPDAGSADAPTSDAAADAPSADAAMPDAQPDAEPMLLSQAGLYSDIASKTIAPGFVEYQPSYTLWADGAIKRRWMKLPPGGRIDTSDMDHWVFPVGTVFFKEFSLGGVLLETRIIEIGNGGQMGAFVWLPDQSDAVFTPDGAMNINGTPHDAPTAAQCPRCHIGEPGHILGFSAMQLSRATGTPPTLGSLATSGLLTNPPPAGTLYPPPGTGATQDALGYFHANCGHCHNPNGSAFANGVHMVLRTYVGETTPQATQIYATTINQLLEVFTNPSYTYRVVPGNAAMSEIPFRMSQRGNGNQMPPIATEMVDPTGVATITNWINSLPP
jgi:hypothetical protein